MSSDADVPRVSKDRRGPATGTTTGRRAPWRRGPTRLWIALLLLVLAVVFIAENRDPAAIRVIVPEVVMPLWAALSGLFVAGVLVGAGLRRRRR